ncbi:putative calmodulin-binding protein Sha1 [Aspergillus ibericus CBS 121593]|uniref:Calmodulin-binding protein Sha1 n=1 Tax=Aspergillus ibericus CBS 121593 TaxID=1448316 RepID=A0A395GYS6_9EURO|nr:calmodulin-binding protein Sha1 [Aspergillus ibericus CBS 121593]RAL00473.1 calmodulin-binding protein Sha1 [Aspergillus ibericus CBS 121593]
MSGYLYEAPTPCPSRMNISTFSGRSSSDSLWNESLESYDDTANVEFTTEIKPSVLTGAKPRRRTKTSASFMIHDEHEKPTTTTTTISTISTVSKPKRESSMVASTTNRKSSLLAQPAQRFRPRVSFAPSPGSGSRQERLGCNKTQKNNELLMQINGRGEHVQVKDGLKKDVRRKTVYIPQDDTTVASAFMGLFSPLKSGSFENCMAEDTQVNTLEAQIVRKRQVKRSLASSAQRAPLRPSAKVVQEACVPVDVAGKNGGKENIPPGSVLVDGKKGCQSLKGKEGQNEDFKSQVTGSRAGGRDTARPSKPLSMKTSNGVQRNAGLGESRNIKTRPGKIDQDSVKRSLTNNKAASVQSSNPPRTVKRPTTSTNAPKATVLRGITKSIEKDYPVISDNIMDSALYEDNWLSHQEVAITQLVNELLPCADERALDNHATLRHGLISLYQGASFTHLHKRLQASLLYGVMSIPKDVLTRSSRLHQDLGMKRKFLDIWVQTYDLRALRAAVEAITGRKIPNSKLAHGSETSDKEKAMKRRLEGFLDVFLLQNQDMDRHEKASAGETGDAAARAYRRTALRSIMMVILLDKARLCPETTVPRRLFLPSSPRKSSAAVLQALGRFLLPSCGDIIKALSHLDCELGYEQHPLEEYEYPINNLAVDLRDGVRLTRIVELLLYPSTSPGELSDLNAPLSCYLKFPCMSRTVKLFNVQVALDALASVEGTRKLIGDVRAEDIVDGHREKTIALLWKLISTWGLAGLVDWGDVRKEIERLKQKAASQVGYENFQDEIWVHHLNETDDEPTLLLKQWASVLAHLKGLRLDNFSTSFSDGKIYESIVDEYEGYVLRPEDLSNRSASLESRLRALGCSAQFAQLVSPASKTHIVDSNFTIGALAFLCSRLLSATQRTRAATVLQTAWRRILLRRDQQRRAVAKDLARQCAAVVQTRDRMLWAQGVIVRWWKSSGVADGQLRRVSDDMIDSYD